VNSEAKAAKKRAKGHYERQVEAETRVKIAKRKAPALERGEEEALPEAEAAAALGTQQQLLEEHEAADEEPDGDDDAPLFQRSFFPGPVAGCKCWHTPLTHAAMHALERHKTCLHAMSSCPSSAHA
jgi:hypothetical protein